MRFTLGFFLSVLSFAAPAAAQEPGPTGSVRGLVRERGGAGLADALLTVAGTTLGGRSGPDGRFEIRGVPAGTHVVRAERVGYGVGTVSVVVPAGGSAAVELALETEAVEVGGVTVIGSRAEAAEVRAELRRVPGGVALVEAPQIRATRQANFHDVLRFTPGVYVQPRFGAADESQLSIRGSGLRNNFHLRGVNVLVNGMAYRNADGFTDFESLELLTTQSIQVYKGGNALRYGGSTLGGAINLETQTGYTASRLNAFGEGGTYGFFKGQVSSGGTRGAFDYYASYARTSLDGYRDWSDQQRDRVNLHAGYLLSQSVDVRGFYFFANVAEHLPGALTQAELEADPTQAAPGNQASRWGRDYTLHHVGVQLRSQLTPAQRLEIAPYFQYRDIDHPIFQVIAQVSRDFGAEVRYTNTAPLGGRDHRLTLGIQPVYGNVDNRRYVNVAGEHGALTKDQREEVNALALYAEDQLALGSRLAAVLGVRYDHSTRSAEDHFLSDGDQSDERTFDAVLPKVGALYRLGDGDATLFANASRSFEPPLLFELNSFTVPGFIDLRGQDAWQFEVGSRGRSGSFSWDVSLYDVELRDEILNVNVEPFPGAGFTVPTYSNADRTRHYGLEAALGLEGERVSARVAYTYARYRFVEDSSFEGNDIPGQPAHTIQAQVSYRHPVGLSITPTLEWVPQSFYVNSANTDRNDTWATLGLRAEGMVPRYRFSVFAAVQNLTDVADYSPSVQVDNAAGRYYEPGDRRTFYAGLRWLP